jgi:NAD(P)-dependent dehydrogenase (short-subunit alcohol dehydrogenase family)
MASTTKVAKYASKMAGSRVLVIGGTSGIGFAVAEASLEQGAFVTISSSRPPKLETALSRLRDSYPEQASNLNGFACDLSVEDTIESNIEKLLQYTAAEKQIDHIVFTAGDALKLVPVPETSFKDIQAAGLVRFYAPILLAKHAPRYMTPGRASSITLTGGTNSLKPTKGWTTVAGWGAGAEGIMRGLAVDLSPTRVNLVSPGAVHTELFDNFPKERLPAVLDGYRNETLTGSVGTPADLAEAYIYCMRCDFVDGQVMQVDGGRLVK